MAELLAGMTTLSLFLGWRLYITSAKLRVASVMLRAVMDGDLVITPTEDGFDLEVKRNG